MKKNLNNYFIKFEYNNEYLDNIIYDIYFNDYGTDSNNNIILYYNTYGYNLGNEEPVVVTSNITLNDRHVKNFMLDNNLYINDVPSNNLNHYTGKYAIFSEKIKEMIDSIHNKEFGEVVHKKSVKIYTKNNNIIQIFNLMNFYYNNTLNLLYLHNNIVILRKFSINTNILFKTEYMPKWISINNECDQEILLNNVLTEHKLNKI